MLKILTITLGGFNYTFCAIVLYIVCILVWHSDDNCRNDQSILVKFNIW